MKFRFLSISGDGEYNIAKKTRAGMGLITGEC
jgi:hypothetical protein